MASTSAASTKGGSDRGILPFDSAQGRLFRKVRGKDGAPSALVWGIWGVTSGTLLMFGLTDCRLQCCLFVRNEPGRPPLAREVGHTRLFQSMRFVLLAPS